MLKNGSCAMRGREPCQVGNQAALSGLSCVPRGCLSGAEKAVNACTSCFEVEVYGSIRHSEVFILRAYAVVFAYRSRFSFFIAKCKGAFYVGLPRFIQKVASR